jgi:hypothetical protein
MLTEVPSTVVRRSHTGVRPHSAAAMSPLRTPAVCAQRRFVLSAAVDVVEHDTREPPLRPAPQVFDVQNARRLTDRTGDSYCVAKCIHDFH